VLRSRRRRSALAVTLLLAVVLAWVVQQIVTEERTAGAAESLRATDREVAPPTSRIEPTSRSVAGASGLGGPTSVRRSPTEGSGTERVVSPTTSYRVPSAYAAARLAAGSATPVPTSTTTTTVPLPRWRLADVHRIADGALIARPLPRDVSPNRGRSAVTSQATKVVAGRLGGSVKPAAIDVFFAEYDAPVGAWLGEVDSAETEARAVWFVVLAGIEGQRSTGVVRSTSTVPRSLPSGVIPTTRSLTIVTDLVVVIDDETGEVLVVSELLSDPSTRRAD
jgi:hypothetical protein